MTRILIAEDNPMVGLVMQADLEGEGYEVVGPFARNAPALMAAAECDLSLALIDIDLAGGDSGIELAAALHRDHGVPCLFVTGQSVEAETKSTQAIGVLSKPFPSAVLIETVAAALGITSGERPPRDSAAVWF